ncbi:hypothetical protein MPSEU_000746100 [Mayamaea pseudoterrestris]|nr:hypothetical protein MPSEU_000746100 [Mayamaea pseudoterrestris]
MRLHTDSRANPSLKAFTSSNRDNESSNIMTSMLSSDLFDHVLDFCHRMDVKSCMAIKLFSQAFQLHASYCTEHGTRLESGIVSPCIDCRMKHENLYRCDWCDGFAPIYELNTGKCGDTVCESCTGSLSCDSCGDWTHDECSGCDCVRIREGCRVAHCRHCAYEACNECAKAFFCEYCADNHYIRCTRCLKIYCWRCMKFGDKALCQAFNSFFCTACESVAKCEDGRLPICSNCRHCCSVCHKTYCYKCRKFKFCDDCEKPLCGECARTACVDLCSLCRRRFSCDQCSGMKTCGKCGSRMCKSCGTFKSSDDGNGVICRNCAKKRRRRGA